MNRLRSFFYLILVLLCTFSLFTACEDDKKGIIDPDELYKWGDDFVLVVNQGVWNNNNSTLSVIDRNTGVVTEEAFLKVNKRQLGDTGNDMLVYGTKVYVAVNVSATIEVLNTKTLEVVGTIVDKNGQEPRQPRQLMAYNGNVYVTYFDGYVAKIDTTKLAVDNIVEVGSNPEGMAVAGGKLYVANSGGLLEYDYGNTLSVINLQNFQVEETLQVGINPDRLCADEKGDLFFDYQWRL
ncbi:MAG: YncE family protein [Bacteroides sp.]|nr:YncE family protein [Bacteroides sp.]